MAGSTIPPSRSNRPSARRNCGVSWALAPKRTQPRRIEMTDQKSDGPKGGSNQNKGSGSDTASAAKISAGTSVGNVGEILAADAVSDPLPLFWFEPPFGPSL